MDVQFPEADDQLFRSDQADWVNNAVLNYNAGKFPPYADGYREGAKILIENCISTERMHDILAYPIVFVARQYFELRMKEMIVAIKYVQGLGSDFPKTHKLDILWADLKKGLAAIGENVEQEEIINAERLILEFANVDPNSMSFRYPIDKNGNNLLTISHINLRNFGEVVQKMFRLFDALSDMLAAYEDLANDMFRELYSYSDY